MTVLDRRNPYSAIPQLEKKFADLNKYITVEEGKLQIKIEDLYGNLGSLTVLTDEIEGRVESAEGDISTVSQKASQIESRVATTEGNISTLTQRANGVDVVIATKADSSTVSALDRELDSEVSARETLVRAYSGGVLTAYVGNDMGVLVNASGSVDIVNISRWSNGNPVLGSAAASFTDDGTYIYGPEGNTWAAFTSDGIDLKSGGVYSAYGFTTGDDSSPLCVTEVYGVSASVNGGNSTGPKSKQISKSGYLPIGIVGAKTGDGDMVFSRYDLDINTLYQTATLTHNIRQVGGNSSSVYNVQPTFQILWMSYSDRGFTS